MRALPVLFVLGLVACRAYPSEPRNAVRIERAWGVATAANEEDALALADVVERARPFLARLPGFSDRPLRIHVYPDELPLHWSGLTVTDRHGDSWVAVERSGPFFEAAVVHELGHFYLHDVLDRLPPVMEEGFCSAFATRFRPAAEYKTQRILVAAVSYLDRFVLRVEGAEARASLAYLVQDVPPIAEALRTESNALPFLDRRVAEAYYGIGFVVADAIGAEGLAALEARRAELGLETIPVPWILDAAGLEPLTQHNLRRAFARAIGQPDLPESERITITLTSP